jgi:diguanylate cyclase (GGDEF)-like protein/PAS domain S-box-containing protein
VPSPYWVVRLSLACLFLLVGSSLTLLAQRLGSMQLERDRALHAAAMEQAARQHLALLQIGRNAATLSAGPQPAPAQAGDALAQELARAGEQALLLDGLLAPHLSEAADPTLAQALAQWHRVREHIWYRGQVLAALAGQADSTALAEATATLQTEVDRALAVARTLNDALGHDADQRMDALHTQLKLFIAVVLVLLGVLALAVLEPAARMVQGRARRRAEQAAELQRLALVAEHTQAMVIITDRDDRILWVNEAFTRLTGWSLDESRGHWPRELLHRSRGVAGDADALDRAIARGDGARVEAPMRTRDGSVLWVDVDLRPLRDAAGVLTGFVSVSTDVTDRMRQRQKLNALWAALPVGVVVHDERGHVADANRAAERLLGLSLAQLQGRDPTDRRWKAVRDDGSPYPGEDYPAVRTLRTGQSFPNEIMGIHLPDGELRWLQVNTEPQFDGPGQVSGVVACFSDVTEARHLQEQLHATARTDALTALPNRAEVMERLKRAIDHAERHPGYGFAVLFMDFDRFKQVNDTLGHAAGDALLRQVSERLRQALRPGDALARVPSQLHVAARIGGDEFVVVLDGMNQQGDVLGVANRLLADLCQPYDVGGQQVQSSASIGIVLSDGQPATAEDVLRNADTAMYEAKRAGRSRCVVFDSSMHERVVHTLSVESDLRTALKEDQIFVVYQPVVDLANGSLVGVEALARWRHPQRGLVPPLEFIGIAEECGLIDAVGSRVLTLACTQFMQWRRELGTQAPPELAVNLSRAQLKRGDVVDEVRRLLRHTGMPPQLLQLEITETLAAQDERIQSTLRELKALGVTLALDDFGTGYSSLACLHQLPVDTVKIDRSFVKHAETVEYHRVLIESTIRMARALGMRTVAEGIESAGQAQLMRHLLCDRGQGYLHGRPMNADELQRWVQGGVPAAPLGWSPRGDAVKPAVAGAGAGAGTAADTQGAAESAGTAD